MKNKRKKIQLATTLITITIILATISAFIIFDNHDNQPQIQQYGLYGIFLSSFLLDLIPQTISPFAILTAAILTKLNITQIILATVFGSTLGSILGFAIGKKHLFNAVDLLITKQTSQKITKSVNKYGKIILVLAAISPFPYLPILFGSLNFSTKSFTIYGLVPRAISLTIYAIAITLL